MKLGVDARGIQEGFKGGVGEYTNRILAHLTTKPAISLEILSSGLKSISKIANPSSIPTTNLFIPNKALNLALYSLARPKIESLFRVNPDLVWMPNWNITALSPTKSLVLTVHDLAIDIIPEVFSARMRYWHNHINRAWLLKRANLILAMSESTKRDLMAMYSLPDNKIQVVYSGIDTHFYTKSYSLQQLNQVKRKYQLPDRYILYLGTIEPRKNILLLVKAFEKIAAKDKNLHLVIAGVDGWLYRSIHAYIQASAWRSRIIRTGFVLPEDKPILYSQALVFVYPSLYEGFGFPPLEAMACGTPTIVSNTSSLPEIVENAAYKTSAYDQEELIAILSELIQDSQLRETYSQQGIKQAKKFSWSASCQQMVQLFKHHFSL